MKSSVISKCGENFIVPDIKFLFFYVLLGVSLLSCAQSNQVVKNVYATYRVHLPGNIAVDANGNSLTPADTINIIYVESTGDIDWLHAWKNGKQYSVVKTLVTELPFDAGTDKNTNEKIMLHPAEGNKLWKLQLVSEDKNIDRPAKPSQGEILLEGIFNGKKIRKGITKQTEITSIPSA